MNGLSMFFTYGLMAIFTQNIVLTGSDSGENTVSLEKLVNNYKATLDQI